MKTMIAFKTLSAKLSAWQRYREVMTELGELSDHELEDIGVRRSEIPLIARRSFAVQTVSRPSWR
jgi:uncharacterized protein YjiS (DUF1127 family)